MKKYYLIIFIIFFFTESNASIKEKLILNLTNIDNFAFDFEQNINGKIEKGNCIIKYPKKIFCNYKLRNQKILVSNGRSLAIKTKTSYYLYPLEKTPLDLILDKNFLISRIKNLESRAIDNKIINYRFNERDNEINIFFDKLNYNLIGWQTSDIYQNLSITFISSIVKNQNLKKNLFILP